MSPTQGYQGFCSAMLWLVVLVALVVPEVQAQRDPIQGNRLLQQVNETFRVRASTVQHLVPVPQMKQGMFHVPVQLNGQNLTLQIKRSTIRSEDYKVLVQVADDQYIQIEPSEEYTVRGTILEMPDSIVSGTLQEGQLYAVVWGAEGFRFGIEPVASKLAAVAQQIGAAAHIVYRLEDVIGSGGVCGNQTLPMPEQLPGGRGWR